MVFVRRQEAPANFLARLEYRVIRPDDVEQLMWQADQDPDLRRAAEIEAQRAFAEGPDNHRAAAIAALLAGDAKSVTDP
jgi:hypothetical protein